MILQMREDSDFWSLPPLTILCWWTLFVITKHPEDGHASRRWTWYSPNGQHHSHIVYILGESTFVQEWTLPKHEEFQDQTLEVITTFWWWPSTFTWKESASQNTQDSSLSSKSRLCDVSWIDLLQFSYLNSASICFVCWSLKVWDDSISHYRICHKKELATGSYRVQILARSTNMQWGGTDLQNVTTISLLKQCCLSYNNAKHNSGSESSHICSLLISSKNDSQTTQTIIPEMSMELLQEVKSEMRCEAKVANAWLLSHSIYIF